MRVGVLASGEGTNLQALLDKLHGREVEVVAVACDQPAARALDRAASAGIPARVFRRSDYAARAERDGAIADWLLAERVELVVLAGYMAILDAGFVARFPDRIVNVHPSLLPAFPGAHSIADALAAGVDTTGVTVHYVDEGLDTGAVIAQVEVPVEPRSTLEQRIHEVEHRLLPQVVGDLCPVR
jgi:phosphoribosylglycinamide formyltransferase 1